MKVQCNCGAKYAIDVTPEMARDPVRFVCPSCNLDLSGPINDLIRQELGMVPAPAAYAAPTPAPVPPPAPAPQAAPATKSTKMRVAIAHAAPAAAVAPAAPARLSISKGASTATHGTATETAPPPAAANDDGQPCPKHKGEFSVQHCFVCRKPICPKCMELFGYVCSPLCRAKANSNGINVPVFAGQKSVREAQQWRKIWFIGAGVSAALTLVLGVWIWYTWIGSVPHTIFSVRFPQMAYAGGSRLTGKNEFVFLHGGLLARYGLGSKKAVWTNEIITQQQLDAEIDRQMNEYKDSLNSAIKHGADSEFRPHVPQREELAKEVQEEMETSLHLFVLDQNVWISRNGKLTRYDWETGKAGQEVALPPGSAETKLDGGELQFSDENAFGQHVITHLSLASGETRTEEIGEPISSAVLADVKKPKTAAKGKKTTDSVGLPTAPGGPDADKPMDPQKVAADAQNLPYAAKIALPATLSNTRHQNQILNEIKQDEADPSATAGPRGWGMGNRYDRSFVNSKYGYVEWSSKVLESRGQTVKVMKDKPARSALESNPSVTNTAAIANEILNDMQRENGGDTISEDVSRYQVTVHRPDAKDVPDWVGEVIGPPSVVEQKTVTVVTGGKMLVVLDKTNKKIWQADLAFNVSRGSGFEDAETSEISIGEGPCVERDGALYVFDAATLTAYDVASGNVRWRVPTIGTVGLFFDDQNAMYVNTTTADLDSIRFARQIDINKKTSASVLRVDCKTGKVFWNVQPGGFVSHVDGKFVFCFASKQAPDLDPDSLTTLPGMLDSAMDIRRLDPKTGKLTWDYAERRCPVSVRFKGNLIELVFRKEVEVLKFISF
jgi:hypothetical protein